MSLAVGVVLLAWGVLWLVLVLSDALVGDADPDIHRVPGWAIKPSLYALTMIVTGIVTLNY